jgi:release factor glutamine methyltransferase
MVQTLTQIFGKSIRKSVQWYLSKPRPFTYKDIVITVSPGVFHPGFFFSTRILLDFLDSQDLWCKNFLEVGSGSGIISICAAKKGAHVTALDISKKAVKDTLENSGRNSAKVTVVESDLFTNVPFCEFDWIVINPPYYPVNPKNEEGYAWNCGRSHQYFKKLFASIRKFTHADTKVLMILSKVCDLNTIFMIAETNGYQFEKILEKKVWADGSNYLFWIKQMNYQKDLLIPT